MVGREYSHEDALRYVSPACDMWMWENELMEDPFDLRERQAPLKTEYKVDTEAGKTTISVRSVTRGDHPMRSLIAADADSSWTWTSTAHPFAGGSGDGPCSGDSGARTVAGATRERMRGARPGP